MERLEKARSQEHRERILGIIKKEHLERKRRLRELRELRKHRHLDDEKEPKITRAQQREIAKAERRQEYSVHDREIYEVQRARQEAEAKARAEKALKEEQERLARIEAVRRGKPKKARENPHNPNVKYNYRPVNETFYLLYPEGNYPAGTTQGYLRELSYLRCEVPKKLFLELHKAIPKIPPMSKLAANGLFQWIHSELVTGRQIAKSDSIETKLTVVASWLSLHYYCSDDELAAYAMKDLLATVRKYQNQSA